jgi:flagellin-like hook-associated protein FlgL
MGKKKKPKKSTEQWVTDLKGIAAEELRVLAQAIEITLEKGEITVSQAQKDMIAKIAHPSQNVEEEEDTAMEAQTEEQVPSPEPPALEPPSDEEGFARVPTKRKRKDRSSPIPNSDDDEQVSGDPPAGPSWRESSEMPQSPQRQPQAGAPEPVKRPRTPPVIIRDSGRWTEVSKLLSNSRIQFTKAKQCAEGIRVTLSGVDHFRAATRLLEKHRVPFHTFTLESEKSIRVVLKPVPREISVEEITEDLQAQGFHPIAVHRMRRLISKKELPLVLVELPPSEKKIFDLKTVCYLTVNVEKPRRSGWVSQCHNCQWFHHSQRNCRAAPRCVKCGKDHPSQSCEKTKETPANCANCGGDHTASYRGCCKFPRPKTASPRPRPQKSKTNSETTHKVDSVRTEYETATTKIAPNSTANKAGKSFAQAATSANPASSATSASTGKFDGLSAALNETVTALGTAKNGLEAVQHFVNFIPKLIMILNSLR